MFSTPFHILTKVIKQVTASAAETELGAIYSSTREGTIFCQALRGMGHPQGATPIAAGSAAAHAILDNTVQARYLKGAEMRLHWMKDRVE